MKKILMSKWFWFLVFLGGGGYWWWASNQEKVPEYETVTVGRTTITEIIDLTGAVEPVSYADTSFEISGQVESVSVKIGDTVKEGQILARLEGAQYYASLSQAETAARIAETDERLARTRELTAGRKWDELKPEEREVIKLRSQQARQNASIAAAQLKKIYLRSPMEGIVTKFDLKVGEFTGVGSSSVRITSGKDFRIIADISESDIVQLAVGQEGTAKFDSLDVREKQGVVVREIEPEAKIIQGVVYYTVHFDLKEQDTRLMSGMSTDIEVRVAESQQALFLPFRSVYETENRVFVEIFAPDGSIIEKDIRIGLSDDEGNIEILSGLEEGDIVVVRPRKSL
ncbi:MAG: efflux RND transporter periplasmic adaptor subunit [Candidatus Moraniibacteriota bacterium]|nr:MAG: efflux RND transporter periplasmic adaptor subunit [Candidatus Moranbacteria bacterium]